MPGNDIDQSIPDKEGDQVQGKEGDTAQNQGKEAENPGNEAENPGNENAEGDQTPEKTEEDSAPNPAEVRTVAKPEAQEVKVAENPAERASDEVDESAKASESERQV